MSHAAKSIFVFGVYLAGAGALLAASPNTLFSWVGLASSSEVWPRVVGVLTLALAFYFVQAARAGLTDFFRWTIYVRAAVLVAFTVLVLSGLVGPVLLLFGSIDALGAVWTGVALRWSKAHQGQS